MNKNLQMKILKANIAEHRKEAEYYDLLHVELYNRHEQNRLRKNLQKLVSEIKKDKISVLDVGAGTGNLVELLLEVFPQKNFEITALDISKEMLSEMKKKLGKIRITYSVQDADTYIRKTRKKFDFVMISSVLHHLPDYEKTLNSLVKITDKNGIIYATHEPLNMRERTKNIFYAGLCKIDAAIYGARYLMLRLLGKVPDLNLEYSLSDYHTKEGGIAVKNLGKKIKCSKMIVEKYAIHYYFEGIANSLRCKNAFELIIYA